MNRLLLCILALGVATLTAPDAWGQQRGGRGFGGPGTGGSDFGLLQQKSVQDELKVSTQQLDEVTAAMEKQRDSVGDLGDLSREERQQKFAEMRKANQEALAKILDADQLKRLNQIALQQRGPRAFADPEVASALSLTGEQKQQIETIQDDARSQMQELFQGGPEGDRAEMPQKDGIDALGRQRRATSRAHAGPAGQMEEPGRRAVPRRNRASRVRRPTWWRARRGTAGPAA